MSTYESRLQQRKLQFIERAKQRLALTHTNLELLSTQPQRSDLLPLIMKEFHQLAAAAGIYQLSELCSIAVNTEDMLIASQKSGSPPDPQAIAAAQAAVKTMGDILSHLCGEKEEAR
jgi:chemotaxis protein histidine kinase CheA